MPQPKEVRLQLIASNDAIYVAKRDDEYGHSWRRRGGGQAFAVIWRKSDRIEAILKRMANGYDIFNAWTRDEAGIRDDIRDLRQYLLLLEEHCTNGDILDLANPRETESYSMPREDQLPGASGQSGRTR